jgi:hypothetical protein
MVRFDGLGNFWSCNVGLDFFLVAFCCSALEQWVARPRCDGFCIALPLHRRGFAAPRSLSWPVQAVGTTKAGPGLEAPTPFLRPTFD